jgi:Pyruvate/2-oxoglutarate dehydrogenase complex, dihydrolipoamide acyltransferase (E2) component, and related enzymes
MAVEVFVPKMTDFMEEAVINIWLVAEGDHVEEGQPLLEMETDKASVTLDSPASGWIKAISPSAAAGSSVPVGQAIAYIVSTPDEVVKLP